MTVSKNCSETDFYPTFMDFARFAHFSSAQKAALLDLCVLGMYLDGHLASAESRKLSELSKALGAGTEYDEGKAIDTAVTRVRQAASGPAGAAQLLAKLAPRFPDKASAALALETLKDLLAADNAIHVAEGTFF